MDHVFVNGTWRGSLSNRSNVTPMMTIHRPPVKTSCTVYPTTTNNNTRVKGGCKPAFSTGAALHSPEQANSLKTRVLLQGCIPTQQCTSKHVVIGHDNPYIVSTRDMRKGMVKQNVAFLQPNSQGQYYTVHMRAIVQPSEHHANLTETACWALQSPAARNSSYFGENQSNMKGWALQSPA